MLLDYANMARDSGIQGVTVKEWISILERTALVRYLKPYASNLNKRLTKTPKLYFMDTGLAVRLQGWQERTPLLTSPQAGALFETLVFSEILKFIQNYGKDWQIHLWRTREGEEIDFLIATDSGDTIALDAKMSLQTDTGIQRLPESFKKLFPHVSQIVLVTFGGHRIRLSRECLAVPVEELHDFLIERSGEGNEGMKDIMIDPLSFRRIPRWNHEGPFRLIPFWKRLLLVNTP